MDKNHGDIYLVDYSREDLNVDNFEAIACSARCLNDGEIEKYAKKWQQIDDKSIMRIVVSEEIQSVYDAYFESLILDCLKDNPLKQIDCLKSSQFNSEVYLSPLLFSYTVKKLIDCGKIIVVEDCEYLLKRKLKKGIEC